ncbi:MAG: DUF4143 domain-containing protein [Bacteroidales bacterium]|jgi:predicted AAA+ superfamily ATPase|nr:DUF4143 domain-containing protein [Bacteroidales bacterium]
MQNISESLAGRAGIISMLGLSLREINRIDFTEPFKPDKKFISAYPKHTKNNYKDIADIIHKGCMPELYAAKSNLTDWADYYSAYFQTYIERDIRAITNIQNTSSFIKFVKAAAALTGERLNYVTLANICGMDVTTVKRWISILETSGLVYILQPYYNNFNKRITKTPKLYFLDTGLVCFLGGWNTPQQLVSGARWGHIFETFVVSEVLKSYYNNGALYPPLCYYRDKEKNEIDLIIEDGDILYPVEIKTSSDPDKGMVKNFEILNKIPAKIIGAGALICLAKQLLPLTAKTTAIPADKI